MSGAKNAEGAAGQRRYKPYPAYKDSGVEWLGEIPAGWEVKRIRQASSRVTDGAHISPDTTSPDFPFVSTIDITGGSINFEDCLRTAALSYAYMKRTGCTPRCGDVLFSKDGTVGTTAIVTSDREFAVASSLVIISPDPSQMDPKWLDYWLNSGFVRDGLDLLLSGAALRRISVAKAAHLPLLLPPDKNEQRAIAAFLDRETARIDGLVGKKERLIELLQEKRTALITRAVTKGLDPNVPMKDSGVEWLGEIPGHWGVLALKRRAKRIQTGTTPPTSETEYYEDGTIAWYGPGSFSDDLPLQAPIKLISESAVGDGVARVFESGSAVVVTIGATIGKVAYMERPGSCNQQITGVTFDLRYVFAKYGAYQLKGLEPMLRGIAPNTTLPILNQEEVGYLPFAVPPHSEQRAIAAFLDRETARLDALVAKVRTAISRLKELRTALISAAVTGKIDVREEAA